jgi:hypothetical protein
VTETNVTPDSESTSLVSLPSGTATFLDVFTKPGEIDLYLHFIRAALAALVEHAGLDEISAKATIEAVVTGKIPNVSISY